MMREFSVSEAASEKAPAFASGPAFQEEGDMPVLTQVVAPPSKAARTLPLDAPQIQALSAEIADSVKRRLSYELPTLLEAVLLNAAGELEKNMAALVETAVRDFIDRRFSSGEKDAF